LVIFDDMNALTDLKECFLAIARLFTGFRNLETLCLYLPDPPTWYNHSLRKDAIQAKDRLAVSLGEYWFRYENINRPILYNSRPTLFSNTIQGRNTFKTEGQRWESLINVKFLSELCGTGGAGSTGRKSSPSPVRGYSSSASEVSPPFWSLVLG